MKSSETKSEALKLSAITYAIVVAMAPEEQDKLMRDFKGSVKRLADDRKDMKQQSKFAAILLAGVEQRVKRGVDARIYASTFTASDLYKQVTGEKPPGHVWTLKNCYINYVVSGFITEADFLGNRNNCLELAQKIADAVIEKAPEAGLTHDAVSRATKELKDRNENEAKMLRDILDSVKPAKPMTAEEALDVFEEICTSGNLAVCLAQMPDTLKALPETLQKEAYLACARAIEHVETAFGDKAEAWLTEAASMHEPVQITHGETPAAAPEADADEPETETDPEIALHEAEDAHAETETAAVPA